MEDGALSAADFRSACWALSQLLEAQGTLRCTWVAACARRWESESAACSRGVLELEGHALRPAGGAIVAPSTIGAAAAAGAAEAEEEEEDPAALRVSAPLAHRYSLHVVYNACYAVPQLLLRGAQPGGAPLPWSLVLADLAPFSAPAAAAARDDGAAAMGARSTFLTPWEHPMRPREEWLALHPCGTRDALAALLAPDHTPVRAPAPQAALRRYMRAWWSLVGGAVGAPLPHSAYLDGEEREGDHGTP